MHFVLAALLIAPLSALATPVLEERNAGDIIADLAQANKDIVALNTSLSAIDNNKPISRSDIGSINTQNSKIVADLNRTIDELSANPPVTPTERQTILDTYEHNVCPSFQALANNYIAHYK